MEHEQLWISSCCKIRINIYLESLLSSWAVSCYWQCSVSLVWDDELFICEPVIKRTLLYPKEYECALGLLLWSRTYSLRRNLYILCDNHRIIELLGLKKTLKDRVQPQPIMIYCRISDWFGVLFFVSMLFHSQLLISAIALFNFLSCSI